MPRAPSRIVPLLFVAGAALVVGVGLGLRAHAGPTVPKGIAYAGVLRVGGAPEQGMKTHKFPRTGHYRVTAETTVTFVGNQMSYTTLRTQIADDQGGSSDSQTLQFDMKAVDFNYVVPFSHTWVVKWTGGAKTIVKLKFSRAATFKALTFNSIRWTIEELY